MQLSVYQIYLDYLNQVYDNVLGTDKWLVSWSIIYFDRTLLGLKGKRMLAKNDSLKVDFTP